MGGIQSYLYELWRRLPPEERARRMKAMREVVAGQNIYDWAIKILGDARRLHLIPGTRPGATRRTSGWST